MYGPRLKTCHDGVGSSLGSTRVNFMLNHCSATYLTFDIISDIVFGSTYEMIEKSDYRFVAQCIEDSNIRTSTLFQARELMTGRIDRYLFPQSIRSRNRFIPFVSSLVKTRMQMSLAKQNDVFSMLLNAKDPEFNRGLGMAEIGGESTTLLMAGKCLRWPCLFSSKTLLVKVSFGV